jgi:hypothetical protein
MKQAACALIVVGCVTLPLVLIYLRRRPRRSDPLSQIALGHDTSPATLVWRSRAALAADEPSLALELACRARDRNDDFVNALPPMAGKVPLRPVVYHPAIYEVMLAALERCRTDDLLSSGPVGGVALQEWRCADNDLPKVFTSGDNTFWGLFLSDYLHLCALAIAAPSAHGVTDLTDGLVAAVLGYADRSAGQLTEAGVRAYESLQRAAGRTTISTPAATLRRPDSYGRFPSGKLIDQAEIERWLAADRLGSLPKQGVAMPEYSTGRPRYPRPTTTNLAELHNLSLRQVVAAQSNPDAWWIALDIAIYRWELLGSYDDEAISWVRTIAYDTFAAKEGDAETEGPLWSWENFVDLFQYCYDRLRALIPTIDPGRPLDLRDAQGHENLFADFLYRCLARSGDVRRLNAFEFKLYTTLCQSQRGNLTAAQIALLRVLEQKYGPCRPS